MSIVSLSYQRSVWNDSVISHFRCSHQVWLNDVYPTVLYSGLDPDDKNVPMKPFFVKAPVNCSDVGNYGMTLLTLMYFANSGSMKTAEGGKWITLPEEKLVRLRKFVCSDNASVFQYIYDNDNVTFLIVLPGTDEGFDENFTVANQMLGFIKYQEK